jgi:hypothetical protein
LGGSGSKVAQYGTMLAEVASNMSTRSVTPISSGLTVGSEVSKEDAWRHIGVTSSSDAFKTNAGDGGVELSDDVELVDARTMEARNSPPDSLGLYRRFQTISPSYRPTIKIHTMM